MCVLDGVAAGLRMVVLKEKLFIISGITYFFHDTVWQLIAFFSVRYQLFILLTVHHKRHIATVVN